MNQTVIQRIPTASSGLELPYLPERADRLTSLLGQSDSYITEANSEPRTIYVSPSVSQILGYSPREVMEGDCVDIHPGDESALVGGAIALAERGQAFTCVVRVKHKRGDWRWLEISSLASYVTDDGGYQSISLNRAITRLIEAQRKLGESEERYRVVSEMSRDVITESSPDGRTLFVSPSVEAALGFTPEELIQQEPYQIVHPEDRERLRESMVESTRTGEPTDFGVYRIVAKDGTLQWLQTEGLVYQRADGEIRVMAVSHDISDDLRKVAERRDLEEQMVSAQKLESLGVMAGGIAHDFNNLLTPILGEASLGLDELPEESPLRARLVKIRRAAERAAALTHQMLSYAGKGPLQLERLDLSSLVEEMGRLFESAVSGKTVLEFDLTRSLQAVEADAAQVSQVVINLISNATEALPDGAGKIIVRTGWVDLDEAPAKAMFAEELAPGRHVFIEVKDSGCGMDSATVAKIFDPFFTTKFTGRGLGLAAVAGIVRGHHGAVEIRSEPGAGTAFRVLFPAAAGAAVERSPEASRATAWRASDSVLVIDDDAGVRDLATDILSNVGLHVVTAADGHEGVEIFRQNADEIHLVLLDRTMPTMSGFQTFQTLRKIKPGIEVILVSGYSEERAAAELAGAGLAGFLQKPFSPETLLELVRKAIDG